MTQRPNGPVTDPSVAKKATISLSKDMTQVKSTMHNHPSGTKTVGLTTYSYSQVPGPDDLEAAGGRVEYQYSSTNKVINVYTSAGVQATLPAKNFVKIKK